MNMPYILVVFLFGLLGVDTASAHEVRPAYLELREATPGEFVVLWKTPMRGEMRLALSPAFSGVRDAIAVASARSCPL